MDLSSFIFRQEKMLSTFMYSMEAISSSQELSMYKYPFIKIITSFERILVDISRWFKSMNVVNKEDIDDIEYVYSKMENYIDEIMSTEISFDSNEDVNEMIYEISFMFHWLNQTLILMTHCVNISNADIPMLTLPVNNILVH